MVEQENEAAEAAEAVAADSPQADDAEGNLEAEPTEVVEASETAPSESAEDADAGADPSESTEEPVVAEAEQAEPTQDVEAAAEDSGESAEEPVVAEAEQAEPTQEVAVADSGESVDEPVAAEAEQAEPTPDVEVAAAVSSASAEEPVAAEVEQTEPTQAEPTQAVEVAADAPGDGEKPGEKPAEKPTAKPAAKRRPRKNTGKPRRALEDITIGEKVNGRVVGLAKFGAFVDIGAKTDGLVHITQFPGRPKTVEEAVKSGDAIDVWVKEVDLKAGRISLTMKEPVQNPIGSLLPGAVVQGTVTSVAKYGIFVDISSDTEGLVHISEMSSGYVSQPEDIAKPGDTVEVRIKEIDAGQRRISLSMVGLANDSGGGEGMPSAAADDYVPDPEPDEPVPTVVELALRKALGDDDSDSTTAGGEKRGKGAGRTDMADLYARMIEDYKQAKARESGDG